MSAAGAARILYVHHRAEVSGASRALALLLRELDRQRFEPLVLSPAGPAAVLFRDAAADVVEAPTASFTHIWASTYHGLRWLLLAREVARLPGTRRGLRRALAQAPRLVHLNDSPLLYPAWVAARRGLPVVWHLRSALPHGGRDRRSRAIGAAVRRLAAEAIAINDDVAASVPARATVVPDPVDLDRFSPGREPEERRRLGFSDGSTVIGSFGYLYPAKGYRPLLEALALLRERGLDVHLVLVGGGVRGASFFVSPAGRALARAGLARDHERDARELARALGVEEVVRIVPYVTDPAPLYRACDVVVVPSQGPEIGLPALEGAAAGLPVVATGSPQGGGIVLPGVTGLLVNTRAPEDLAAALAALATDPARRHELGRAAREHAERRFAVAGHARAVEAVYDRILGQRDGFLQGESG